MTFVAIEVTVPIDFYVEYMLADADFELRMDTRINNIKRDLHANCRVCTADYTREKVIEEHFVEVFSWSVIPFALLQEVGELVEELGCKVVVDPCCGNAFHTYLFETFTRLRCLAYDIQEEPDSWADVELFDCKNLFSSKIKTHGDLCLLMSWVDYEQLGITILREFCGPVVLNVGNYEDSGNSFSYLSNLRDTFSLVKKYELHMPWGLTETIEVYKRK